MGSWEGEVEQRYSTAPSAATPASYRRSSTAAMTPSDAVNTRRARQQQNPPALVLRSPIQTAESMAESVTCSWEGEAEQLTSAVSAAATPGSYCRSSHAAVTPSSDIKRTQPQGAAPHKRVHRFIPEFAADSPGSASLGSDSVFDADEFSTAALGDGKTGNLTGASVGTTQSTEGGSPPTGSQGFSGDEETEVGLSSANPMHFQEGRREEQTEGINSVSEGDRKRLDGVDSTSDVVGSRELHSPLAHGVSFQGFGSAATHTIGMTVIPDDTVSTSPAAVTMRTGSISESTVASARVSSCPLEEMTATPTIGINEVSDATVASAPSCQENDTTAPTTIVMDGVSDDTVPASPVTTTMTTGSTLESTVASVRVSICQSEEMAATPTISVNEVSDTMVAASPAIASTPARSTSGARASSRPVSWPEVSVHFDDEVTEEVVVSHNNPLYRKGSPTSKSADPTENNNDTNFVYASHVSSHSGGPVVCSSEGNANSGDDTPNVGSDPLQRAPATRSIRPSSIKAKVPAFFTRFREVASSGGSSLFGRRARVAANPPLPPAPAGVPSSSEPFGSSSSNKIPIGGDPWSAQKGWEYDKSGAGEADWFGGKEIRGKTPLVSPLGSSSRAATATSSPTVARARLEPEGDVEEAGTRGSTTVGVSATQVRVATGVGVRTTESTTAPAMVLPCPPTDEEKVGGVLLSVFRNSL